MILVYPEIALLYFGLFMSRRGARMIPEGRAIAVDTWATIENQAGQRLEMLIEDGPSQPADHFFNPAHPFVVPALGLKAGETFAQQKTIGPPENWRIVEVKHKYLHMLHEMHHFNVRFPDAKGFYYLSMEDSSGIPPLLEQVKERSERIGNVAALYIDDKFPLAVVAGLTSSEPAGLAEYVRSLNSDIVACDGNHLERVSAEQLALRPPQGGTVMDFYTAWIAARFNLITSLKKLFGNIIVPRSVIDTIVMMQRDTNVPSWRTCYVVILP